MAGRKHHHVPQFLQRRFGANTNKTTQVVVYKKGKEPFKTSTENFGAQRDFYAHEGDFFVDDLITKYEGDIQFFFSQLEKGSADALQDTTTLSELVAHLELRSSFLRSQLFEISGVLSGFLESIFGSEARLAEATYRHLKANPQILRDIIVENLGADSPVNALKDFVEPQLKSILRSGSSGVVKEFASKLATMRGEFSEMVKSSHLSILSKGADEVERTSFYRDFSYSIQVAPTGSFILPDTMVAFCSKSKVTPFSQKGSNVTEILLPLSSKSLLIGKRTSRPNRTLTEINSLLASTSFQSFIAIDDLPEFRKLSSKIGRNASIFSQVEANRVFNDFVSDFSTQRRRKQR